MSVTAPAGTHFTLELQSAATPNQGTCKTDTYVATDLDTKADLKWTFDGTEHTYLIPFSKFPNAPIADIISIYMGSFSKYGVAYTLGPLWLYCPNSPTVKPLPSTASATPSSTVATNTTHTPAPTSTAKALVIDTFKATDTNDLGHYHGGDDGTTVKISGGKLTFKSNSTDLAYYSALSDTCFDLTPYKDAYIHIAMTSNSGQDFSLAVQQNNVFCDQTKSPFPETWAEVQASRYTFGGDVYVPISHLPIVQARAVAIALRAFTTAAAVTVTKIEIVPSVPANVTIPDMLPTVPLIFGCVVPNTFAFCMDDGQPQYAQQIMKAVKDAGVPVTMFTVGEALQDTSTNFTNVYKEALGRGYEVALHSFTHPYMASIQPSEMDWEFSQDQMATYNQLGVKTNYFRPPFGNVDARMRQRAAAAGITKMAMWSVDIRDYLYPDDGAQMLAGFKDDINAGGTITVAHFLTDATVATFPQFLAAAKATGKRMVTFSQCIGDTPIP